MKIKFLLLNLGLFTFSAVMAQQKTTVKKSTKTTTTTVEKNSNDPLYQQYENQVSVQQTSVITSPAKAETIEDKYQMIIDQNLTMIKEIDNKIEEKRNAYRKDEKQKNNSSISSELTNARFQMIAEIIGTDAANYYIKKH
jgi:nitrate/TMAO reductase-like tetraheme cytochrome c subunit